MNNFVKWCLDDHPEITYCHGKNNHIKRRITAKHPRTIKLYVGKIRLLLEDVWDMEVNTNKILRQVKIPKAEEEEDEPFTKEQMRINWRSIILVRRHEREFFKNCSNLTFLFTLIYQIDNFENSK